MLAVLNPVTCEVVVRAENDGSIISASSSELEDMWETCWESGVINVGDDDEFEEVMPNDPNFASALSRQWLTYGYYLVGSPQIEAIQDKTDEQPIDDKQISKGKVLDQTSQPDNTTLREGLDNKGYSRISRYQQFSRLLR